jgi:hypothetical protein
MTKIEMAVFAGITQKFVQQSFLKSDLEEALANDSKPIMMLFLFIFALIFVLILP